MADRRYTADKVRRDIAALTRLYGDVGIARVVSWRIEQLSRAGFSDLLAASIATTDSDWRQAIELVRSGCDHGLAARIVLP